MELIAAFWDLVVHLDQHLAAFVAQHGAWVYALLFAIVFCETGLVVTPFLPGDSLLFVAGAIAAVGGMDIFALTGTLIAAALCGDNVNYWAGAGRVLPEVVADARKNRPGELVLVGPIVQPPLLVGIGNERRLDEDRRDVRRFQHVEARLLDLALVQRVDGAELAKDRIAQA